MQERRAGGINTGTRNRESVSTVTIYGMLTNNIQMVKEIVKISLWIKEYALF